MWAKVWENLVLTCGHNQDQFVGPISIKYYNTTKLAFLRIWGNFCLKQIASKNGKYCRALSQVRIGVSEDLFLRLEPPPQKKMSQTHSRDLNATHVYTLECSKIVETHTF